MRIVLAASESVGYECLKSLLDQRREVVAVIVHHPKSGISLSSARVTSLARQAGLILYETIDINDPDLHRELALLRPDILFNVAFVQIYQPAILQLPRLGCINFHPGPLPRYGGSNGWVWAIINGETEYGVCFHYMKAKVDAGDILARDNFPITPDETGRSLLSTCFRSGAFLFKKLVADFAENQLEPIHQDLTQRSYYYNRVPNAGLVDFSWDTARICRFVRALTFSPFPNPLSPPMLSFGNEKFVITKAGIPVEGEPGPQQRPGTVLRIEEAGVLVSSGDGAVVVRLADSSRAPLTQTAFCQLKEISAGSIFETPQNAP